MVDVNVTRCQVLVKPKNLHYDAKINLSHPSPWLSNGVVSWLKCFHLVLRPAGLPRTLNQARGKSEGYDFAIPVWSVRYFYFVINRL